MSIEKVTMAMTLTYSCEQSSERVPRERCGKSSVKVRYPEDLQAY